jgi:DNA-directed RNA polymerase subunit RPC12/RpoP
MAATIVISCPECHKQIKAPATLEGKKIRCKGCGHTFAVKAAPAPKGGDGAPGKAASGAAEEDDFGDFNPYAMGKTTHARHCPFCAHDLDRDQVVCLKCGYNLLTRTRIKTRTTYERTAADWMIWLGPGIGCVMLVLCLLVLDVVFFIDFRFVWDPIADWITENGANGIRLWMVIMTLLMQWFALKFAFRRLILHPVPPEKEKG